VRVVVRQQRFVVRHGVTIHHRGGPIPEAVVDDIISQLEEGFRREGWKDVTNEPPTEQEMKSGRDHVFWREDEPIPPGRVGYYEPKSEEIEERERSIRNYEWNAKFADPGDKGYYKDLAEYGKKRLASLVRRGVMIPDDFKPTRVKGVCANPDPHSETFCVRFVKDDAKDEWRDTGDFTKTQFVRTGPGVHISLCDFLEDVQRKVRAAGADFIISDEGGYCDDEKGHTHNPREVVEAVNETAKVINGVMGSLARAGWQVAESAPKQPAGEYSTGTLDDWIGEKGADLLVAAPTRTPIFEVQQALASAQVAK
jgi:hypothetical protein